MGSRIAAAVGPIVLLIALVGTAAAQEPATTRAAAIERVQAEKAANLHPYVPNKAEQYFDRAEALLAQGLRLHPFFQSAYAGGGFTITGGTDMSSVGAPGPVVSGGGAPGIAGG